MGAVESVKSASDINTPVSGEIIEANGVLEEKPGNINKSPEGDAWMAKIKVSNASELEELMDADAYQAFTDEQDH
jgi:glycine cleavage system H protein